MDLAERDYQYGFYSQVPTQDFPKGINPDVIRRLSGIKEEPEFVLNFRLKAFAHWEELCKNKKEPRWAQITYPTIDYQDLTYYSAPKSLGEGGPKKLEDLDPELLKTFERLGIPLSEQKRLSGIAVDAVFDSVSLGTTHQEELFRDHGVIFCSLGEAIKNHPDLVKKYLGRVVPYKDNFFAALNSAAFGDGSFVYIPKGVQCPMDLSTYFRINAKKTGQFERTLIVADEGSSVSYLEGCTAPMRDENQLHAAVVELYAHKGAQIQYSTVQNWYGGDKDGKGGIYNFVTKRGLCAGDHSRISWTQVETGSAITWKYPSVILKGDDSVGEFYSVALTNNKMEADTGTKMVHLGRNTRSRIVSKGITAQSSRGSYRGLVSIGKDADGARNHTVCDSMMIGSASRANTYPVIRVGNPTATVEHEATTAKISADQIFYFLSRGISEEQAVSLLLNGFCKDVFQKLPLEFSAEAVKLLEMKLEGSLG
jgi:Fe-S cluster assembly protein SufB